ncbi:MAG: DUF928 domain-containing protein, partial [Leptolyngbya sp. SIO3F4]|nr:DUF928 domain-containing protein [Leptolyngbya sp. SIO3F4]
SVDGWTRRIELSTWIEEQSLNPDLPLRLESATPLEKARLLYQEAHLWNDAAVILEDLHQTNPNNPSVAEEWNNLMQIVNLSELDSSMLNRVSVDNPTETPSISSLVD